MRIARRTLVTGAAGRLGTVLRQAMAGADPRPRFTDRVGVPREPNVDFVRAELAELPASGLLDGMDAVVHLAAESNEAPWPRLQSANVEATHALYEAARRARVGRIVLASSFHVVGFYEREQPVLAASPPRPDSLYAVSKVFGEALARYYWDKFGIESAVLRIGSCQPEPHTRTMLSTWLSHRDFVALVVRSLAADRVGFTTVYGVSANDAAGFTNDAAGHLGWVPQDNAASFADRFADEPRPDPRDPVHRFRGGTFVARGSFDEEGA